MGTKKLLNAGIAMQSNQLNKTIESVSNKNDEVKDNTIAVNNEDVNIIPEEVEVSSDVKEQVNEEPAEVENISDIKEEENVSSEEISEQTLSPKKSNKSNKRKEAAEKKEAEIIEETNNSQNSWTYQKIDKKTHPVTLTLTDKAYNNLNKYVNELGYRSKNDLLNSVCERFDEIFN